MGSPEVEAAGKRIFRPTPAWGPIPESHTTIAGACVGPGNRPLDMEWLEDFLALAETGNFSRAAEARAIAQPAFSRHIRSLEEWMGVDLVDRSAHPAGLTAAPHALH